MHSFLRVLWSFVTSMRYLPFLHLYLIWLLSSLAKQTIAFNPATQTAKGQTAATEQSSKLPTKALIKSAQRLSTATVVTVAGEIVSVDVEQDVFVNGIEVLTGSRRSSMATSSHHAKSAISGEDRPATSTAAPPQPLELHGHVNSRSSREIQSVLSSALQQVSEHTGVKAPTTPSVELSFNKPSKSRSGKSTKSAEESNTVSAILAAIKSLYTPTIAHTTKATTPNGRGSSLSRSSRNPSILAGHMSSTKAHGSTSRITSATHHSPATSAVPSHSSSTKTSVPIGKSSSVARHSPAASAVATHLSSANAVFSNGQTRKSEVSTSSDNAYSTISSLSNLASTTVETTHYLATDSGGSHTTVTTPVTIGAGGVIVGPPVLPIGFPGLGGSGSGGVGPNDGSGENPDEPQTSGVESEHHGTQTPSTRISSVEASSTQTSSTQTSTASCSDCDFCLSFDYNPTATPNPLDDNKDVLKRELAARLAGRFYNDKRRPGNAVIKAVVASGACPVSRYTPKPEYPGPGSVANNQGPSPVAKMAAFYQTATFWAIPTPPPCNGAPGWTFVDTPDLAKANPPYTLGGNSGKRVNVSYVETTE